MRKLLGISITRQWREAKQAVVEGGVKSMDELETKRKTKRSANPSGKKCTQQQFCRDYIKGFVKYLNAIPDKHGTKIQQNEAIPVYELPFRGVYDFHKEMMEYYLAKEWSKDRIPKESTFRRALLSVARMRSATNDKKQLSNENDISRKDFELRFLRCKGSHASCEVCLNAASILEDRSFGLGEKGKSIIRKYRSLHLSQQGAERDELAKSREAARNKECVFLMGDFMSEFATKIPQFRYANGRQSKEDMSNTHIGLALYGVEVIFGKIEGIICYLVPGYYGKKGRLY